MSGHDRRSIRCIERCTYGLARRLMAFARRSSLRSCARCTQDRLQYIARHEHGPERLDARAPHGSDPSDPARRSARAQKATSRRQSNLIESGLDSLAVTQLMLAIEEATGVWTDESLLTPENLETAETLAASIYEYVAHA